VTLWGGAPLVLASKSAVRRSLLEAAGIPVEVDPADIDERAVEAQLKDAGPDQVALMLAREKALAVGLQRRDKIVLGADQTLALGSRRFSKPGSTAAAREQLAALSGQTHALHSGVAIARDGSIAFETVATARLTMRTLPSAVIDAYIGAVGSRVLHSVGAYQLEGLGVHLFERIEGDYFTILGLPLLSLLAFFRREGLVP
jgi:septum formation protein